MKIKQKWIALLLVCCLTITSCTKEDRLENPQEKSASWELAKTTPFGKYPEEVTYTLGKLTGMNNSNMPEGDTYEDNAYTRYLKDQINVQNQNVFEASDNDNYHETMSMVVASKELPDVMIVDDMEILQLLVKNDMIADLTQAYQDCTSTRIKEIYKSYGNEILGNVTFDGKLMALPETNIDDGPSLLWLRKDWLDKLNLQEPKTLQDVEEIIQAFVEKDPGGNGAGKTVGLVCNDELTGGCGYSYEYQTDIIFANYGAFPKQWIYNEKKQVVYGSVQPEVKQALKYLRKMYQKNILDQNFLMRESSNIIDLVVSGKCGSFFGPWWAPNNPLMSAKQENPDSEWMPYLIHTTEEGATQFASKIPSNKYIVVRKGYENPEIVMKIVSVLFDEMTYGEEGLEEQEQYFRNNVDPTARPLAINVDYKDALLRCYLSLKNGLQGQISQNELGIVEGSFYAACNDYLSRDGKKNEEETWENWAAYTSRITACSEWNRGNVQQIDSLFFGETETMKLIWWRLEEMEKKAYLEIITGQKPISYFDNFVNSWKKSGGEKITKEVAREVQGDGNKLK